MINMSYLKASIMQILMLSTLRKVVQWVHDKENKVEILKPNSKQFPPKIKTQERSFFIQKPPYIFKNAV